MAALAAGALLWGIGVGPASADSIRDGQWALKKYDAETKVWPLSQGDGVTVGLIDTGVLADHQDLTGQILAGADFSGEQSDGRVDKQGHGTVMASLIVGHGHGDHAGIMGLAPKAKILPVRVSLRDEGDFSSGEETKLAEAIRYAADHGVKVINLSVAGGLRTSAETRAAVSYAVGKDIVLVAGNGNLGNHDTPVSYPAAFPGVVAVGAVDEDGKAWDRSNRGPETTLAAPGVGVYGAGIKSSSAYIKENGTSDATAYVSAIAALIRSKYPQLSAGQVINRMIKSAVAPPDGSKVPSNSYGYGIASPSKALAANPAVDNGPKENPLLARPESQGAPDTPTGSSASGSAAPGGPQAAPAAKDSSGIPVYVYAIIGVVALVVIVGIFLLVRRSGRRNDGGGPGGYAPPTAPPSYNPGAQPYPQQHSPQPNNPYAAQPPQQYPPQAPPPPPAQGGQNPYR